MSMLPPLNPHVQVAMLRKQLRKYTPYTSQWYKANAFLAGAIREWRKHNTLVSVKGKS